MLQFQVYLRSPRYKTNIMSPLQDMGVILYYTFLYLQICRNIEQTCVKLTKDGEETFLFLSTFTMALRVGFNEIGRKITLMRK